MSHRNCSLWLKLISASIHGISVVFRVVKVCHCCYCLWFWFSETFDRCCLLLPAPTVPQPQPESRPQEHYLEQQARLHHPNSHLLLHRPFLLPDNHRRCHTQVTYILCTQTRSAVHKFILDTTSTLTFMYTIYIYVCVCIENNLCFSFTVSNIMDVYLNTSGSIEALKGDRLVVNCTATAELNTRVNITWDYPGKVRPKLKSLKTLTKAEKHRFRCQITSDRHRAGVCNTLTRRTVYCVSSVCDDLKCDENLADLK